MEEVRPDVLQHEASLPDEEALQATPKAPRWWERWIVWRRTPPTILDLARKAFDAHHYEAAIALYEKVLEREPDSVEGRRGISLSLLHKGGRENLQSALTHIQVAVSLSPYRSGLHRIKSAIYSTYGMAERAGVERHHAAVIAALPNHLDDAAHQNQAGIAMQSNRLHELAVGHFRNAIRLMPEQDAFVRNLAIVLYKRAMAEPDAIARAELLAGALTEALRAVELNRTPAALLLIALIYEHSGAYDSALKRIEEAEVLDASFPGLARLKAEIVSNIEDAARYAVGAVDDPAVERLRSARNRVVKLEGDV